MQRHVSTAILKSMRDTRNGKPVEIFQVTCHWVAATGTGDDASSSMLNLLQRVESVGRQSSEKRVAVVNV